MPYPLATIDNDPRRQLWAEERDPYRLFDVTLPQDAVQPWALYDHPQIDPLARDTNPGYPYALGTRVAKTELTYEEAARLLQQRRLDWDRQIYYLNVLPIGVLSPRRQPRYFRRAELHQRMLHNLVRAKYADNPAKRDGILLRLGSSGAAESSSFWGSQLRASQHPGVADNPSAEVVEAKRLVEHVVLFSMAGIVLLVVGILIVVVPLL